jgi:hypothetical protein
LGVGQTTPPHKKQIVTRTEKATAGRTYLGRKDKRSKYLKIGSWNVLSLYRIRALEMGGQCGPRHQAFRREELENLALNREEWRKLLKKARVHTGLSSQ